MSTNNFEEIKNEILKRAHDAKACTEQYVKAYKSETLGELMHVVKDNFYWAIENNVLTPSLIKKYREEFASNDIFLNVDADSGYLICDNATVEAWGNTTVKAYGNATVEAWGNANVKAYGNANVKAYDNATVEAWGNTAVEACGNATVKAYDNANVEAYGYATVEACGNANVEAYGNATVEAWGNAYCTSYFEIKCKLSERAIYRVQCKNIIYYADDSIKFLKK